MKKTILFSFLATLLFFVQKISAQNSTTNLTITTNYADVANLTKLEDIEINKSAIFGRQEKLQIKALEELKQKAAAAGASIIYVNINQFIVDPADEVNTVNIRGALYRGQPGVNNLHPAELDVPTTLVNVRKNINNRTIGFFVTGCTGNASAGTVTVNFIFFNESKSIQKISLSPNQSNAFDREGNKLVLTDFTFAGNTLTDDLISDLPSQLNIKGSITFSNVANNAAYISEITFPATYVAANNNSGNIDIKNLPIDWRGAAALNNNLQSTDKPINSNTSENIIKNPLNGINFNVIECTGDAASQTATLFFDFTNSKNNDQNIHIGNSRDGGGDIGLTDAHDYNSNKYSCSVINLANSSNGGNIYSALILGSTLKGSVTFINVLPTTDKFALINMPVACADLDNDENGKRGIIEIRNVSINWQSKGQKQDVVINNNSSDDNEPVNSVQNINSGLDFNITGCTGDGKQQKVTVFFTLSNPKKVNQKIHLGNSREYGGDIGLSTAYDYENNLHYCDSITLANISQTGFSNAYAELIYGNTIKGSVTYSAVLPSTKKLSLVNIPLQTSNFDGGGNEIHGIVKIKNITINWLNKASSVATGSSGSSNLQNADYLTYSDLLNKLNASAAITNKKIILNNIYFKTNEAIITDESQTTLQNVLKLLIKYPRLKIRILGHTDNVGRDDDNLDLSTGRAKAILTYLVSKGINRDRLFYKGFGSTQPIADNGTDDGKAKNRRTEMEIVAQ